MFIMLFSVLFFSNILVLDFWVFKVSLFLSNQFSFFLSSLLTTFSTENELLPEQKVLYHQQKEEFLSLKHLEDHLCIGEIK